MAPENGWLEDEFPFGIPIFWCYISFREGKSWKIHLPLILCVVPIIIGKMVVPLGWYPNCLTPPRSPVKLGNIPNKYSLYKVSLGLIVKGPPSQVYHHFPYDIRASSQNLGMGR